MIAALLFVTAMAGTLLLTVRRLSLGVVAVLACGYLNGIIRANILSPWTTFMFDAALAGLFAGALIRCPDLRRRVWRRPLGMWVFILVLWPAVMSLIPINHILVQLVAFRASIWFLLVILIGAQLDLNGIKVIGRWLALLNVVALGAGIYIYFYGVPSLYPQNAVTALTYRSRDVAGEQWRIPSTFLHAQSYGGSMLLSIPFMIALAFESAKTRTHDKLVALAGTIAALSGILLCGARVPVVLAILSVSMTLILSRANPRLLIATLLLCSIAGYIASQDERLQRSMTLLDSDLVSRRVESSVNSQFIDLMIKYPMGGGMGSAFGTSIPFFLSKYAPNPIGAENEFSRIQINQGVLGMLLWIGFLFWFYRHVPSARHGARVPIYISFAYALTLCIWMTAWIGAGATSAIPGASMMFLVMGLLRSSHLHSSSSDIAVTNPPQLQARPIYGIPAMDPRRR